METEGYRVQKSPPYLEAEQSSSHYLTRFL